MLNKGIDLEQILSDLARSNTIAEKSLQDVLRFILKNSVEALEIWRSSIWLFDSPRTKIRCIEAVENGGAENCVEEIFAADCPIYFNALETLRTIAVIDVETDPRAQELLDTYFHPLHITTTLDVPLFQEGEVVGVVCFEHTAGKREWSERERAFAASLADAISLAFEAHRRIEAEKKLSETEELLLAVTNQMSDGFCLLEPDEEKSEFIIRHINPVAAEIVGYLPEELLGKPSKLIKAQESNVNVFEIIKRAASGEKIVYEEFARHKNGSTVTIEVSLNVIHYKNKKMIATFGRDISQRKEAERERLEAQAHILQAQRLESLGMFAGKVAHDFNNLLVGILGYAGLAAHNLPESHPSQKYLDNIQEGAKIAAELCNQLLTYSGKQKFSLIDIDLCNLVKEMVRLLEVSLPKEVELLSECGGEVPIIFAEPTQIRQIVLNLVTNASDALAGKRGVIKIATSRAVLTAADLTREKLDVQADDFAEKTAGKPIACLEVSDNGEGMDEATRQRVFEPFFSTKISGRGLGLATLAGIVRTHHGAIKVESKPQEGTTFRVYFPAAENR